MQNLFAYGTLMCDQIFLAVTGIQVVHQPATLAGFRRWSVRGEVYPAIVPDQTGIVDGLIYGKLPASVWKRLDHFEGQMYARQRVMVRLSDGSRLPADTYVWLDAYADLLLRTEWSFSTFVAYRRAGGVIL